MRTPVFYYYIAPINDNKKAFPSSSFFGEMNLRLGISLLQLKNISKRKKNIIE